MVATVKGLGTSPAVGVVVGDGVVYVAYKGGVALVDPERAEVTDRIEIRGTAFYDLKILDDMLWASDAAGTTLYGFDLTRR